MKTMVTGPQNVPLSVVGFGLLRAPMVLAPQPASCSASVASLLGAMTAIEPAFAVIQTQLQADHLNVRMKGLQAMARLFAEKPHLRLRVQTSVETDPQLKQVLSAWNDGRWVKLTDIAMGFGEYAEPSTNEYFDRVVADLPDWTPNVKHALERGSFRSLVPLAFASLKERLDQDETIEDDSKWNGFLVDLFVYYSASCARVVLNNDSIVGLIQKIMIVIRALARLRAQGGDASTAQSFEERLNSLIFTNGHANLDGMGDMRRGANPLGMLWKEIYARTPPADPLVCLKSSETGKVYALLSKWLADALCGLKTRQVRGSMAYDYEFIRLIDEARQRTLSSKDYARFRDALLDFNRSYVDAKGALHAYYGSCAPNLIRGPSPISERRRVIWNPYALVGRLFLHPTMGEVFIEGEPDDRGMVLVRVPRKDSLVKVMRATLIGAEEKDVYEEALRKRIEHYAHKAPAFAALGMVRYLSAKDPALAEIRRGLVDIGGKIHGGWYQYLGNYRSMGIDYVNAIGHAMWGASKMLGFDAIAWGWLLTNGHSPDEILLPSPETKKGPGRLVIRNAITSDMVRGFCQLRPWQVQWSKAEIPRVPNIMAAGFYYVMSYRGEKINDLTQTTHDFVWQIDGSLEEAARLLAPHIDSWVSAKRAEGQDVLLVPMVGTGPTDQIVQLLGYPHIYPWLPRPANYGGGVEGLTLFQKMQKVGQAMKLNPEMLTQFEGKTILIVDDNVTDKATYMQARRLLFDAGARNVGIAVISETIRNPREISFVLR